MEHDRPVATPLANGGTIRTAGGWWLVNDATTWQEIQQLTGTREWTREEPEGITAHGQ